MRNSDEETLTKCQSVIRRTKVAMMRARNINIEVQSVVSKSENLIDIMRNYREKEKTAGKEKQASKAIESAKNNSNDCDVSTPVSSFNKRSASSLQSAKVLSTGLEWQRRGQGTSAWKFRAESEDLIDIMRNYRENWKTAVKEASSALESAKNNSNVCVVSTLLSSLNKRYASNPMETRSNKRLRGKQTPTTPLKERLVDEK